MKIDREKFFAALLVATAATPACSKSEFTFGRDDSTTDGHADAGVRHPSNVPYGGPAKEGGVAPPAREGGVVPPAREGGVVAPPAREGGVIVPHAPPPIRR